MNVLDRTVSNPLGAFAVLMVAAFLEVFGDSFFQVGMHREHGAGRVFPLLTGIVILACYGAVVNVPRWDFGKLLGLYVVLFFVVAQVVTRVRFNQSPTPPIYAGGALIVAGGLVMAFWKG